MTERRVGLGRLQSIKVYPEVENDPIGRRRRWQTRTRDQVLADLRGALGVPAS